MFDLTSDKTHFLLTVIEEALERNPIARTPGQDKRNPDTKLNLTHVQPSHGVTSTLARHHTSSKVKATMVRLSATFAAIAALAVSSCEAFSPNAQNNGIASKAASAFGGILPAKAEGQQSSQSQSLTEMSAMLTQTELPEKLYFKKESPKVLGGLKIGTRELVVVTGASSGLGLNAAATLAKTGRYFVVMACRDVEKAKKGEFAFWGLQKGAKGGDVD